MTATLTLTPWAHEALSLAEMTDLGYRAVEMRCRISVGKAKHRWTIRVSSWAQDERHDPIRSLARHHQRGHLADLIHATLDEYQRDFLYSPDELVQIARQTNA